MQAIAGKRYRHYKGREYTVLSLGRLESHSEQVCVIYRAEYPTEFGETSVWIRPIENFEETVVYEGNTVDRFRLIEDTV